MGWKHGAGGGLALHFFLDWIGLDWIDSLCFVLIARVISESESDW